LGFITIINWRDIMKIKLKFVTRDTDRHGNIRYYFRRSGQIKVRLSGEFNSPEFLASYDRALKGLKETKNGDLANNKHSFGYLCKKYMTSPEFALLDVATQQWRRSHLERICNDHAHADYRMLQSKHIIKLRNEYSDKPAASRSRIKALKALYQWAIENGLVDDNPTKAVKFLPYYTDGHHTWTLEELQIFEAKYPVGTQENLALNLLLYTACRREDVVRLGPQHLKDGRIKFKHGKNEHRKPVIVDMPIHQNLQKAIEACPSGHMTFLVTKFSKPFSKNGFANKFKDACRAAGLANCSMHGLRKLIAKLSAEKGCTTHEIAAITGHTSLAQVEIYTREATRKDLADQAMTKLGA
jgi:integrase/recombinase XerD